MPLMDRANGLMHWCFVGGGTGTGRGGVEETGAATTTAYKARKPVLGRGTYNIFENVGAHCTVGANLLAL